MNAARTAILLILCVGSASCADRLRAARALMAVGGIGVAGGILTATGCNDVGTDTDGCSGGPDDVDLAAGIPLIAGGAALLATGVALRPRAAPKWKGTLPPPFTARPTPPTPGTLP